MVWKGGSAFEKATDFSKFDPEKIVNPDKVEFNETEENLEMQKFEDYFKSMLEDILTVNVWSKWRRERYYKKSEINWKLVAKKRNKMTPKQQEAYVLQLIRQVDAKGTFDDLADALRNFAKENENRGGPLAQNLESLLNGCNYINRSIVRFISDYFFK